MSNTTRILKDVQSWLDKVVAQWGCAEGTEFWPDGNRCQPGRLRRGEAEEEVLTPLSQTLFM